MALVERKFFGPTEQTLEKFFETALPGSELRIKNDNYAEATLNIDASAAIEEGTYEATKKTKEKVSRGARNVFTSFPVVRTPASKASR